MKIEKAIEMLTYVSEKPELYRGDVEPCFSQGFFTSSFF